MPEAHERRPPCPRFDDPPLRADAGEAPQDRGVRAPARGPQFPDPRTTVPSNPAGIREITDFDGAILLFPASINLQAPAYKQALTACGAPPLGLPH